MKKFRVGVIGRTNVGKSTLFNAMVGRRVSIEHSNVGSTRDFISYICMKGNKGHIEIVDTGGYISNPSRELDEMVNTKVVGMLQSLDLILWIFDLSSDLTEDDLAILKMLREQGINFVPVGNKADAGNFWDHDFASYGIIEDQVIKVSAIHRKGIFELKRFLQRELKIGSIDEGYIPKQMIERPDIRISVFGRPNAGKSTFMNTILRTDRSICSEIAGTTRDIVTSILTYDKYRIAINDTPGLVQKCPDTDEGSNCKLFQIKAIEDIKRSNVCVVILPVTDPLVRMDKRIIQRCMMANKPVIVCLNKVDLLSDGGASYKAMLLEELASFNVTGVSIIAISAKTGRGCDSVIAKAVELYNKSVKRVHTATLNRCFGSDLEMSTGGGGGKIVKPQYITQTGVAPVSFILFMNVRRKVSEQYKSIVRNKIIKQFDLGGVPVLLDFKIKSNTLRGKGD